MNKQELPAKEISEKGDKPTAPRKTFTWKGEYYIWILALIGLVVGGIGVYQRFTFDLRPTDLGSFIPWGLWVGTYEYLVWLEVGSLTVFTLLVYVFKFNPNLLKLARNLYISGIGILAMALILIGLDLGHPFRFFYIFTHPQWGSLMTWMIWLHIIYLVVLVIKLVYELRPQTKSSEKAAAWLSYISLPLGVALVVVAGSVFGVVAGRPTWQGSSLPIYFLVSALAAGAAVLVFQFVWCYPHPRPADHIETAKRLGKILLGILIVGLMITALIGLVILYPGVPSQAVAFNLILFGPFWWVFWILHIGIGVIVAIALLLTKSKAAKRIGIAAGLFILTFITVPLSIIIQPQLATGLIEKNLVVAYQGPRLVASYFPTLSEWLVTLFAVSFGFLVILTGHAIFGRRTNNSDPVKEG